MVGDDAVARQRLAFGRHADRLARGADQRLEQVDVVVVVLALEHRGDALEAHAGVDRRPRQAGAPAIRRLLILHEDEVPDLDEAVAVRVRRARRPAGDPLAMVVEDLRARPARPGLAHPPEIVGGRDAHDALVRQAGDLAPEGVRLVVLGEHRDQELLGRQRELAGDQRPGMLDRLLLEVVAEGEIAEHLEEGVVARGVADVVEVVVLAARAHGLLGCGRPRIGALLDTGEDVLELNHPGVREHQGRIVARHQRRRRHDLMAVAREIVEEGGPDLVDAAHGLICSLCRPLEAPMPTCRAYVNTRLDRVENGLA